MLILANVVVVELEMKVVAQVLHIEVEALRQPLGVFSTVLTSGRLPLLLAALHLDVRVHLAEHFSVTGQLGLNQVNLQFSNIHIHFHNLIL